MAANSVYFRVRCHIVHLSSTKSLKLIQKAQQAGAPLTVETTHHYLSLCAEHIPAGATQFKCCPPIRGANNQVWNQFCLFSVGANIKLGCTSLTTLPRSSYGQHWKLDRLTWWCLIIHLAPLTWRKWTVETSLRPGEEFLHYSLVTTDWWQTLNTGTIGNDQNCRASVTCDAWLSIVTNIMLHYYILTTFDSNFYIICNGWFAQPQQWDVL